MRTMKVLCFLLLLTVRSITAQVESERVGYNEKDHKGSYLTISGSVGSSRLDYTINGLNQPGETKGILGYGIEIKYSYFFTGNWGITSGIGVASYGAKGKWKGGITENSYFNLGTLTDNDPGNGPVDYELRARVSNLEEKQTVYMVEIPLMLSYQTYFNCESSCWGLYGGVGAKLQLPVSSTFSIQNGSDSQLNISGYYSGIPVDMGSPGNPPVPQHGYGTITDPGSAHGWDDDADLKTGVAATAELGVMFSLGRTTDLKVGGYIDYGLTDIKKSNSKGLVTAPAAYHPAADNNIGNGIRYNGMLNSDITGRIKPFSFGAKVALYFKL